MILSEIPSRWPRLLLVGVVAAAWLTTARPAQARRLGRDGKPRLGLWDRVLYKRYKRADKIIRKARQASARGKYADAVKLLKNAVKIRPYAASVWFELGTVHSYSGDYAGCVKTLHKARKLSVSHKKNLIAFRLGLCLTMSGKIAAGIKEYQKASPTRWITSAVLSWNMADGYMALGRLNDAIQRYRWALARNPDQLVLHFALAVALDRAGRYRSADRQLRRANRLDPLGSSINAKDILWLPSYDHLYYRALRSYSVGRRLDALAYWQKFVRAAPKSAWKYVIRQRLGMLRTTAFAVNELRLGKGKADRKLLATELTRHHAALRGCLGSTAPTTIAGHVGVELALTFGRRGLTAATVARRVGAVPSEAAACFKKALKKVKWRKVLGAERDPATITFSLVGP